MTKDCRVGMTTNIVDRLMYWQGECPNMKGWKIIGEYPQQDRGAGG